MQAHDTTAAARPLALIVDDDDGIRETMAEILGDEGFDVIEASNGLEALNVLASSQQRPALICLDMAMPVMDGWAFCRVRERISTLTDIPVVAISGSSMNGSRTPLRVDALLQKPFAPAQLAWLATRMTGRQNHSAPIRR